MLFVTSVVAFWLSRGVGRRKHFIYSVVVGVAHVHAVLPQGELVVGEGGTGCHHRARNLRVVAVRPVRVRMRLRLNCHEGPLQVSALIKLSVGVTLPNLCQKLLTIVIFLVVLQQNLC